MLDRIDHVGVAVREDELDRARGVLEDVLGAGAPREETVEDQGVRTLIYEVGDAKVELLVPLGDEGPLAGFLESRGSGLHHLAFEVEDVQEAIGLVAGEGVDVIDEEPRGGVEGSLISFLHPKSTFGTLLELVEFPEE